MKNYERGKLKVVWIESNPEVIYSKMFETKKAALEFAKNKEDFLLFRLISQEHMQQFSWKLLPYGHHSYYITALGMYRNSRDGLRKLRSVTHQ